MARTERLLTELTDPSKTADMITGGIATAVQRAGNRGPLANLSVQQIAHLTSLVLYALGEVYERQFYPDNREDCQEVAAVIRRRAGLSVPPGVVVPRG